MRQILLIDDDPIVNFIHSKVIQSQFPKSEVLVFNNGLTALEYIKGHRQLSYLIFLDLNMPVMNGWDFLNAVAAEESELALQIHVLTSSIDPQDKIRAQQNKLVNSYLSKPLKCEDLQNLARP
mgnify:FL=1